MKDTKELLPLIREFYTTQIENGKGKSLDACTDICVSTAQLPAYLKTKGIDDWKTYGHDRMADLLAQMGIATIKYGATYFYISDAQPVSQSYPNSGQVKGDLKPERNITSRDVRNAYRKIVIEESSQWIPLEKLANHLSWNDTTNKLIEKYKWLQVHVMDSNLVRVQNIAKYEIEDDISFGLKQSSYTDAIDILRAMALKEDWDGNGVHNDILDNYIRYTYSYVKAQGEIILSQDERFACWNTGLVDYRYQSIYCYMRRQNPAIDRWQFKAFCIAGEDVGKGMVDQMKSLPNRPQYFKNGQSLLYEPVLEKLACDIDHIMHDHPSRLPVEWLSKAVGQEVVKRRKDESEREYDARVGDIIKNDLDASNYLHICIESSIKLSVIRCQWNYKTAIPYYDAGLKKIGWFLPLCNKVKSDNGDIIQQPYAALVVTKGKGGMYQGQTIYRLDWAYRCARLVCRPDSDWLTPIVTNDAKLDTEE